MKYTPFAIALLIGCGLRVPLEVKTCQDKAEEEASMELAQVCPVTYNDCPEAPEIRRTLRLKLEKCMEVE